MGGPGWSAASSQASQASWPSSDVKAMIQAFDLRPGAVQPAPPPPAGPPPSLETCMFGPDHGNNKWGGAVLALPSQVLGARPSQVGGPHAAVDLAKNPPGTSSSQPVAEGGDASKVASVSSTPDSDAEVDALVERTFAREQYHRLCDQQRELIMHESVQREWE